MKAWHDQLGRRISSIQPTANLERTIKYCQGFAFNLDTQEYEKKPGSVEFEEYGRKPEPGKRNDLIGFKRRIDEGESVMNIAKDEQMFGSYAKYSKSLHDYSRHVLAQTQLEKAREPLNEFQSSRKETMHWESHLKSILFDSEGELLKADPTKIYWYFETAGDKFKRVNAKRLLFNQNTYLITGGRALDIYYAYHYIDIVIYNQCASQDRVSSSELYKVWEEFKDGCILAKKYHTPKFAVRIDSNLESSSWRS